MAVDLRLFSNLKWFFPQTITVDGSCKFTIAMGQGQILHDSSDNTYTCLGSFDGYYVVKGHAGYIEGKYGLLLTPEMYVTSVNWGE